VDVENVLLLTVTLDVADQLSLQLRILLMRQNLLQHKTNLR
jgi:hypothetical protein